MTIYHIDPTVSGPGAGSEIDPYKSYVSVPPLSPGDKVLQKRGTTFAGSVAVLWSGSAGSPVVFGAYGAGALPVIDARGAADASCIEMTGRDFVTVTGLRLVGASDYPGAGVRAVDCNSVVIDGNEISGTWYGVRAEVTGSAAKSGLTVTNNEITDTLDSWVLVIGSNVSGGTYSGITIDNNTMMRSGKTGVSIQTREPTDTVTPQFALYDVKIRRNTLDVTGAYGIFIKGVLATGNKFGRNIVSFNRVSRTGYGGLFDTHCIWLGGCQYFHVDRNIVSDTYSYSGNATGSGVGVYVDVFSASMGSSFVDVTRNHFYRCGQGGTTSSIGGAAVFVYRGADVNVVSNLGVGCRNGVVVQGAAATPYTIRVNIHGNTMAECDGSGSAGAQYMALAQAKLVDLRNNIGVGGKLGLYKQTSSGAVTSFSEQNNCFSGNATAPIGDGGGTATAPSFGTAMHASDTAADPLLSASYRPMAASPMLSAGVHVGYARDGDMRQRQNPPSIGAFEPAFMAKT